MSPDLSTAEFVDQYRRWVQEAIAAGKSNRENCWTESIAVGSSIFIEETKFKMGINAKGRSIYDQPDGICVPREESAPYNVNFTPKNEALSVKNAFLWDNCLTI